jgi:peptide/nickel transport system substrate-binding protein
VRNKKHLSALVAVAIAAIHAAPVRAQQLRDVPRNRTLISQGWDYYNQVPTPTNLSPSNGVLLNSRNILHYAVGESLFYTNHLTNTVIPCQAERMETSPDYREVTVTLRPNVKWADGGPLTADDVVFTFETLRNGPPAMALGGAIREWVESVTTTDARTIKIRLKKPGPRWAEDTLATGQTTRFVVLPQHV